MRRRRHVLQVSTFPFLAVLLCTMGSLILILLVIDRRAKCAALEKEQARLSRVQEEDQTQADADALADWERRRLALHALLVEQEEELASERSAIDQRIREAGTGLEHERTRTSDLQQTLQHERAKLEFLTQELKGEQDRVKQKTGEASASRTELARWTAELAEMERALAVLREVRKRDQQTYSLIPYRGKRGDQRKPIYIECAAEGLIFHPDRLQMHAREARIQDVRTEVQRRLSEQQSRTVTSGGDQTKLPPYLLFLVRPDGITTYHKTIQVLEGMPFEFGYEFVDADWVLDFPVGDEPVRQQPWMTANTQPPASALPSRGPPGFRPTAVSRGVVLGNGGRGPGSAGGNDPTHQTESPGASQLLGSPTTVSGGGYPRGTGSWNGGAATGPGGGTAQSMGPGIGSGHVMTLPPAIGRTGGMGGAGGSGSGGLGTSAGAAPGPSPSAALPTKLLPDGRGNGNGQGSSPSTSGSGIALGAPQSMPGGENGYSSTSGTQRSSVIGSAGTASSDPQGGQPGAGSTNHSMVGSTVSRPGSQGPEQGRGGPDDGLPRSLLPGPPSAQAGGTGPSSTGNGGANRGGGAQAEGQTSGESGGANQPSASNSTSASTNSTATRTGGGPPGTAETGSPGSPGSAAGGSGDSRIGESGPPVEGGEEDHVPSNPLGRMPSALKNSKARPNVPPPQRLVGNRDWLIAIECTAEGTVLYPSGQRVGAADLVPGKSTDKLAEMVEQLIARRQASVRPGDLPYRPLIRFLVRPDGLETYYRAYPLLARLGVPMSRQSLEKDEDIRGWNVR